MSRRSSKVHTHSRLSKFLSLDEAAQKVLRFLPGGAACCAPYAWDNNLLPS